MSHKFTLTLVVLFLALFALTTPASADHEDPLWLEINNLLDAGSDGGTYGFRLKVAGGPVILSFNADGAGLGGVWYPASTIKVAHHLHALRWAEQNGGLNALDTMIPVYSNSCSGTGDVTDTVLSSVLTQMMVNSDNGMTNAAQDYFGRNNINDTLANVVGMSNFSRLEHKFGCGGPTNNPANSLTANDIVKLYEEYLLGNLLGAEMMDQFESMMLNEINSNFMNGMINSEGNNLGLSIDELTAFFENFDLAYKGGSIPIEVDGTLYRSRAGLVRLPIRTCDGIITRDYAFAVFIDGADSITVGTGTVINEMLRDEVANALATFPSISPFDCLMGSTIAMPEQAPPPFELAFSDGGKATIDWINSGPTTGWMVGSTTARVEDIPRDRQLVGDAFWLGLLQHGVLAPDATAGGVHVAIADVNGLHADAEPHVRVFDGTRSTWTPVADLCGTTPTFDTVSEVLEFELCQMGEVALLAPVAPTAVQLGAASAAQTTHAPLLLLTLLTLLTPIALVQRRSR